MQRGVSEQKPEVKPTPKAMIKADVINFINHLANKSFTLSTHKYFKFGGFLYVLNKSKATTTVRQAMTELFRIPVYDNKGKRLNPHEGQVTAWITQYILKKIRTNKKIAYKQVILECYEAFVNYTIAMAEQNKELMKRTSITEKKPELPKLNDLPKIPFADAEILKIIANKLNTVRIYEKVEPVIEDLAESGYSNGSAEDGELLTKGFMVGLERVSSEASFDATRHDLRKEAAIKPFDLPLYDCNGERKNPDDSQVTEWILQDIVQQLKTGAITDKQISGPQGKVYEYYKKLIRYARDIILEKTSSTLEFKNANILKMISIAIDNNISLKSVKNLKQRHKLYDMIFALDNILHSNEVITKQQKQIYAKTLARLKSKLKNNKYKINETNLAILNKHIADYDLIQFSWKATQQEAEKEATKNAQKEQTKKNVLKQVYIDGYIFGHDIGVLHKSPQYKIKISESLEAFAKNNIETKKYKNNEEMNVFILGYTHGYKSAAGKEHKVIATNVVSTHRDIFEPTLLCPEIKHDVTPSISETTEEKISTPKKMMAVTTIDSPLSKTHISSPTANGQDSPTKVSGSMEKSPLNTTIAIVRTIQTPPPRILQPLIQILKQNSSSKAAPTQSSPITTLHASPAVKQRPKFFSPKNFPTTSLPLLERSASADILQVPLSTPRSESLTPKKLFLDASQEEQIPPLSPVTSSEPMSASKKRRYSC